MPGKTLPTLTQAEVESHNSAKSCYVTLGRKVYDVTPFIDDHPGGSELILEYAGKDVTKILRDVASHEHSDSAYEIMDEYIVGIVGSESTSNGKTNRVTNGDAASQPLYEATGMSSAEDLTVETDITQDYKTHKFLDLGKPLLSQLWFSGFSKEFYLQQVHRPRHYKGGEAAPLFGNFLEPFSKTAWYVIPIVWLPPVAYGTFVGYSGLGSAQAAFGYWTLGFFCWSIIEYCMHRFLFHMEKYLPDNRVGLTLHFLLHGIHHYLPMDKYRLVMPPALFLILATPFWKVAHSILYFNWYAGTTAYCGGVFGYICYDLTHYFLHHKKLPPFYATLKKYHLEHHFADYNNGFGVTSPFWDWVFGTQLLLPDPKTLKTQ